MSENAEGIARAPLGARARAMLRATGHLHLSFLELRLPRRCALLLVHAALWALAFATALQIRFEGAVPLDFLRAFPIAFGMLLGLRITLFLVAGLVDGLWRYAGVQELRRIVLASALASAGVLAIEAAFQVVLVPRGVLLGEWLASIVLVGGARLFIRTVYERRRLDAEALPVLILGAGDAGESLLRDVQRMRDGSHWRVVGFLDDDPRKQGTRLHGKRVIGPADEPTLRSVVRRSKVALVVLAWPTANGTRTREVMKICRALRVRTQTVPSLAERIGSRLSALRELNIDDLLRRDPVQLDSRQVSGLIRDKVVLVTGAGGSIGSELSRQVLPFAPRTLLLLDHDENAVFFAERELRQKFPDARVVALVADMTDAARIDRVFRQHRPSLVLHAAAHKHVGLMEGNPAEAARNNVFGTQILAEAAAAAECEAFILISTDKAVNPTSVMGATKRVCEMVVQDCAQRSRTTRFAGVRFGNVLGSAGSVVPLFREQIAKGGPVTVTDPEVCRYFMTIPEAAQLVLQAAALTSSGEIFLLDMGKPVKIVDLARDLIELSGLRPDVDIAIQFTGLKPGEKLTEELLLSVEAYDRTPHPKIMVGRIQPVDAGVLLDGLGALRAAVLEADDAQTRRVLSALVPEATLEPLPEPLRAAAKRRPGPRRAARRDEVLVATPASVTPLARRQAR